MPAGLTVGEATAAIAVVDDDRPSALDVERVNDLLGRHSMPDTPAVRVATEVADMIDNQPEEVAQLLRGWLGDRRATVR